MHHPINRIGTYHGFSYTSRGVLAVTTGCKKGHANDANNYRGITLISCLEKIFTSVINNRLLKWLNENSIVTNAQFGFKPGYGTTDAMFSVHTVISKVLSSKKKLYCCFVDYRNAFDSVNRYKL